MYPSQIKRLMSRFGLTQQQLADRIGVHRGTVADWARGKNEPRGLYLRALESLESLWKQPDVRKVLKRKNAETLAEENLDLKKEVTRLQRRVKQLMDSVARNMFDSDTQEEAKTIYRSLVKKYHPDHNPQHEEIMRDINELWQATSKHS